MSGALFYITSFFFFVFSIVNGIAWLKLWEDKEFKWKRVFIHLKDTKQGRSILFGVENITKWILILVYSVTIFVNGFDNYYHLLVFVLYFVIFLKIIWKVYNRDILLPNIPLNNILIILFASCFIFLLFVFPPLDRFLWIIILDKSIALIIALFVALFLVFFDFNTDIIINNAVSKLANNQNLLSIAVVGSYGKGSTKEFISRILLTKFNVLENKTPYINALGIARTILKELSLKKQIFIAEMDDYKAGDIQEMSNIIHPKIAVVTGINNERMSIFGNMEKIIKSKNEVIESIPHDGIVIFNGNNKYTRNLYGETKIKKFIYTTENFRIKNSNIKAFNIKQAKFSLSFDILAFGRKYKISKVKLLGLQNVENLLPGIFIGLYLGLDFSVIRKAIANLRPLPKTMEPNIMARGTVLINDTYNANINSVKRVLDYMKLYKGRRIFVLEPLIELGKNAYKDHYSLGLEIGKVCDYLFLTNNNYYKPLIDGVNKANSLCMVGVFSPGKIAEFIEREGARDDVVVFEGQEAYNSLIILTSELVH